MVFLYLTLVLLGWVNIYAAVYNEEHQSILDASQRYGKQLIWISLSIFVGLVILLIDGKFYSTFAIPIYVVNMLLLVVVLVTARDVAGARSWIDIGSFKLQPSEFAKSATALALSYYLSTLNIKMGELKTKLIAGLILAIPAGLILLQNDTGSMLVFWGICVGSISRRAFWKLPFVRFIRGGFIHIRIAFYPSYYAHYFEHHSFDCIPFSTEKDVEIRSGNR